MAWDGEVRRKLWIDEIRSSLDRGCAKREVHVAVCGPLQPHQVCRNGLTFPMGYRSVVLSLDTEGHTSTALSSQGKKSHNVKYLFVPTAVACYATLDLSIHRRRYSGTSHQGSWE